MNDLHEKEMEIMWGFGHSSSESNPSEKDIRYDIFLFLFMVSMSVL